MEVNKKCIEFLSAGLTWAEYNEYANGLIKAACEKLGLAKISKLLLPFNRTFFRLDVHDPDLGKPRNKSGNGCNS